MLPAFVFAAYTGTLELSDRSEGRVRASAGPDQPLAVAYDLLNAPSLSADVHDRRWQFAAVYAPTITLQDLQEPLSVPIVLNYETLAGSWHARTARLSLREEGTIGDLNTTYLGLQQPAQGGMQPAQGGMQPAPGGMQPPPGGVQPLQLVPAQVRTIFFGSLRATLLAEARPTRRWLLSFDIGYLFYGGLDPPARTVLPLQQGPRADASATYAIGRSDSLLTQASAWRTKTDLGPCFAIQAPVGGPAPQCAPDSYVGTATEGLRHAFSRTDVGSLSVGASIVRARLNPTDPYDTRPYPVVAATYDHALGRERYAATTIHFDGQVAPVIDFLTGLADYRAQAMGRIAWQRGHLTLSEALGAVRSLGGQLGPPATFLISTSTAEYAASKRVALVAGVYYVWQDQSSLSSAVVSLAVTIRALPARF